MGPEDKIKVYIKPHSFWAYLAAQKLRTQRMAITIGHTIHLHQTTPEEFILSKKWLKHELKHVEQYERLGVFRFVWLYLKESIQKGYYNNSLEVEARAAESDDYLLAKYELTICGNKK